MTIQQTLRAGLVSLAMMGLTIGTPWSMAQTPATASAAKLSIADFFRGAAFASPQLSPDGQRLAALIANSEGVVSLAVFDLKDLKASKMVASFSDVQIASATWVNDKRLVFTVRTAPGLEGIGPGLWGVDANGEDLRQLISPEANFVAENAVQKARILPWTWQLLQPLDDNSDDVIVQQVIFNTSGQITRTSLSRLNTRTQERIPLATDAPTGAQDWILDRQGLPSWTTTIKEGRYALYKRKSDQSGWDKWDEGDLVGGAIKSPVWMGPQGETYALRRHTAKETTALFTLNVETKETSAKPIVSLSGYDLDPTFVYDAQAKKLVGIHFETDAHGSVWFDEGMKQAQAEVDKRLPQTVNILFCRRCAQVPTVMVLAHSDRSPGAYFLYNRDTKALTPLAQSMPWIDPAKMAGVDVQQFAARDGTVIPVQVTAPKTSPKRPLPTVVLVHGGPYVRGNHWGWNPYAQFLASRGYVVIEPEFRGSQGYGFKHHHAGWKQWGLAMQDDVTDATQWAIKQGLSDPKRICIAGASYGGYATLMGLIKEHDLYQCGINWVGVTDIELLYTVRWSDASDTSLKYGMPVMIGDPDKDAALLRANSPLLRAKELKRPLLMAYGEDDVRVPTIHGTQFRDAVKATNPDVEWVSYVREGHGWRQLKTNEDFWARVERFLERNIGEGAKR